MRSHNWFTAYLRLAACLTAGLVAGCAGNSIVDETEAAGVPVAFATAVDPTNTRAGDATTDNLRSMSVFACYTGQENMVKANYDVSNMNFMSNQRVDRASNTSPWTYSPVKYWPNTAGDKITFIAFAPYISTLTAASGGNLRIVNEDLHYTVPPKEADQIDLLMDEKKNAPKGTSLNFNMKHMLTKVETQIKSSMGIVVTKLELKQAHRLTSTPLRTLSAFKMVFWQYDSRQADYLGDFTATLGSGGSTSVAENTLTSLSCFYLPSITPTVASIALEYHSVGSTQVEKKVFPIPVATAAEVIWESGRHIIYTIVIDGIKLTVTVSNGGDSGRWTDGADIEADYGNF